MTNCNLVIFIQPNGSIALGKKYSITNTNWLTTPCAYITSVLVIYKKTVHFPMDFNAWKDELTPQQKNIVPLLYVTHLFSNFEKMYTSLGCIPQHMDVINEILFIVLS